MVGRILLKFRKDGRFFVRCKATYIERNLIDYKMYFNLLNKKIPYHVLKNLRFNNISIHRNFYQNQFINECGRKNFVKIP